MKLLIDDAISRYNDALIDLGVAVNIDHHGRTIRLDEKVDDISTALNNPSRTNPFLSQLS